MNCMGLADLLELHPSPIDKEHLDGPKLARWIRRNHSNLDAQLENDADRVREWEGGTPAGLVVADRVLVRLDSHIHQLPPDTWIDKPPRRPRRKRTPTGQLALPERKAAAA